MIKFGFKYNPSYINMTDGIVVAVAEHSTAALCVSLVRFPDGTNICMTYVSLLSFYVCKRTRETGIISSVGRFKKKLLKGTLSVVMSVTSPS